MKNSFKKKKQQPVEPGLWDYLMKFPPQFFFFLTLNLEFDVHEKD